jgi:hypothetical protein
MLTLIVPGLIWTRQALADLTCDLPLPAFTTLLGRGRLTRRPAATGTELLADIAGLAAPLPAAALRRLGLGLGANANEEADWLCLDPVRLNFQERSLVVDDPQNLRLTTEETAALAVALAPTFAELGTLEVLAPTRWNLRLAVTAPAFRDLPDATGRAALPLPLDAAYAPWRQALNEAQMVLHAHPVNQARTRRRAAGGQFALALGRWPPATATRRPQRMTPSGATTRSPAASPACCRSMARRCRTPSGVPPRAGRWPSSMPWNGRPAAATPSPGATRWRASRPDWLAPAGRALREGKLTGLRLLAPGEAGSVELVLDRGDAWRFWRKPRPLADLAPS